MPADRSVVPHTVAGVVVSEARAAIGVIASSPASSEWGQREEHEDESGHDMTATARAAFSSDPEAG
jgi:hypothetical protein